VSERQLMPVQVDVIKEVLVDRILAQALERLPGDPPPAVRDALEARLELPAADGGALDLRMRRIGYLTRIVEAELFEPARRPMDGLAERLARELTAGAGWSGAVAALSGELAAAEPLSKPSPEDERAVTWKVPGPGGHVRHYVVAAAIAETLTPDEPGDTRWSGLSRGDPPGAALPLGGASGVGVPPGVADAGELKRCWTYGFLVRCCEEAAPPALEPAR
jgi:hypothetical protein